jgi:ABC-2 type transport system permease protein
MKKVLVVLLILIGINILSAYVFIRADLTEEKRYSVSTATENLLENLQGEVFIKVYLNGEDLPGGFERLKRAVAETLDEFKTYGGSNISYRFIDPNAISDIVERDALMKSLVDKGMQPTNVVDTKNGRRVENLIFPYATVQFDNKETDVLLLKSNQSQTAQEKLNQSYENVEYELATAIRKLTLTEKKRIGMLTEFTKLPPENFAGLITELQSYYDLFILDAKASITFEGLDAIILPKPDFPVDDSTKLKLDQFIVNGGKALFFVDGLKIDSIGLEGTYAQPLNTNIEDLLFKYGVRINKDMVKDGASAAVIPMVVGNMGDKPNIQPVPYRFFPLINSFGNSLITKNLDLISTKFVSSIDTVQSSGIKKTPLLMTTPYTRVLNAPVLITFNEARTETKADTYQGGVQTVGYLLEGTFGSLYKNRLLPTDERRQYYSKTPQPSKIIICSDGDIIINEINRKTGNPMPLGYDKVTQHTFGNMDFVMNAVDYLLDDNGVITARGKEVKLRPLDTIKIREERTFWQSLNIGLPLLLLACFGGIILFVRKRKYQNISAA